MVYPVYTSNKHRHIWTKLEWKGKCIMQVRKPELVAINLLESHTRSHRSNLSAHKLNHHHGTRGSFKPAAVHINHSFSVANVLRLVVVSAFLPFFCLRELHCIDGNQRLHILYPICFAKNANYKYLGMCAENNHRAMFLLHRFYKLS